jgi:trypsin-like peptidase/effector-associated domain 1 (EAD1)-containing protein
MNVLQDSQRLHRALLEAFSPEEFSELLRFRLGLRLDRIASARSDMGQQVFEVVQLAEHNGWTDDLVKAAFEAKPTRRDLGQLYRAHGLGGDINIQIGGTSAVSCKDVGMEGVSELSCKFHSLDTFHERLAEIEPRVCRVEVTGTSIGTGFLVGPEAVLTCSHVVADVLEGKQPASFIRFRFDYRVRPDGVTTEGVLVNLHPTDWLIDFSPLRTKRPKVDLPALDYALLRLDRRLGEQPLDPASSMERLRGWLRMPEGTPAFAPKSPLFIAQYAQGGPLKIAMDVEGVIGFAPDQPRVRYTTGTEPGAAGAPCFDGDWNLVAMHQSRLHDDKGTATGIREGIPIAAIRDRLKQNGVAGALALEAADTPSGRIGGSLAEAKPPAPGPIVHPEDPQQKRWGEEAQRHGRELGAELLSVSGPRFIFNAFVQSTDGTPLQGPVIFHLHDTYPQPVIYIRKIKEDRVATLYEVESYGVYTIGAQVKDGKGRWIGLEYCLTELPGLPSKFMSR